MEERFSLIHIFKRTETLDFLVICSLKKKTYVLELIYTEKQ